MQPNPSEEATPKAVGRVELSEREQEILKLVATGASNKQIAQQLAISPNTVKVHLRNIFGKIGAATRTEAALYAVRAGLADRALTSPTNPEDQATQDAPQMSHVLPEAAPAQVPRAIAVPTGRRLPERPHPAVWLAVGLALIAILIGLQPAFRRQLASATQVPPTAVPRWQTKLNLPTARAGLAGVMYDNQIYAIGGETTTGVTGITERYDVVSNTWTTLASKPGPVTDIEAAVAGGLIYVPGGRLASGAITNTLAVYDPEANLWSQRSPIPAALSGYALATLEGKLYLFGGWDGVHYVDTVYSYDPQSDEWRTLSALPLARGFASAAAAAGRIYVIGGTDGSKLLTDNEEFNPDSAARGGPAWRMRAPLPVGRSRMASATVADIIHVIGGEAVTGQWLALEYVTLTDTWQPIELPQMGSWSRLAAVSSGTFLFAFGGVVNGAPVADNLSYQALYTIILPAVH